MNVSKRSMVAGTLLAAFLAIDTSAESQILRRRRVYTPPPAPPPAERVIVEPTERVNVQPAEAERVQPAYAGSRRLSYFLQRPIRLNNGVSVGKVRDYVLNDQGSIEYFVVWHNGRYVLVPYSMARLDWGRRYITVDMDRNRWNRIPSFTNSQWSTVFAQQSPYLNRLNTYFGIQATPGAGVQVQGRGTAGPGGTIQGNIRTNVPRGGTVPGATNPPRTTTGTQPNTAQPADTIPPAPGTQPRTPSTQPNAPGNPTGTRGPINPPQPLTPPRTTNPIGPGATPPGPGANPTGPGAIPPGPGTNPPAPGNIPERQP